MAQLSESLARDAIRRIRSNQLHCLTANEIDQALWAWLMLNGYEPRPTQETRPAPPCFWCGCEKEHPDHKFGAGKNHAYRVGSVVTKEEREAYALNR